MNKTTDRIKRRWDHYRARIAELEAENAKLRKQVEQLAELVKYAVDELRELPELNMSNYNEDDVHQLNNGVCAIFQHLEINSAIMKSEATDVE